MKDKYRYEKSIKVACKILQNDAISDRSALLDVLGFVACEIVRELAKVWTCEQDYLSLAAHMHIWDATFPNFWQGFFPKHSNIGAGIFASAARKIASLDSFCKRIISVSDTAIIISAMVKYVIFCKKTLFRIALKEQIVTKNCIICLNIIDYFSNGRKRKRSSFD